MNFKKKMRGYDPADVDKYLQELENTSKREMEIRVSQKERIDQLTEENHTLRQQVQQYKTDHDAISQSLIASQNLAQKLKFDAEKYSDVVLTRAKIFYATWRTYSQTLISSLSNEEVEEFNRLQQKIEDVINAYEGKDVAKEMDEMSRATGGYKNPISKIEQVADQAIDLSELARNDLSLDDLCSELGLMSKKG